MVLLFFLSFFHHRKSDRDLVSGGQREM